jgi:hypothetical protein
MTPLGHLAAIKTALDRTAPLPPRPRHKPPTDTPPPISPANLEAIQERTDERAAIIEFEAGESRDTAERIAKATMRVYRVHVAMGQDLPPRWATFIAPGCNLAEATAEAQGRFGPGRVLAVLFSGQCAHEGKQIVLHQGATYMVSQCEICGERIRDSWD